MKQKKTARKSAKRPKTKKTPARGALKQKSTQLPVLKPRAGKAPIVYDPLKRYLREISRHPLLTPEEEKALVWSYYKAKDPDAALKLVVSNLRLVVKIALEYHKLIASFVASAFGY